MKSMIVIIKLRNGKTIDSLIIGQNYESIIDSNNSKKVLLIKILKINLWSWELKSTQNNK